MRMVLLAGAVLALSACGGHKAEDNLATDNMSVDSNLSAEGSAGQNGAVNSALESVNAAQANGSINAATANAMAKDAKTYDPDTNLANGM